MLAINEEARQLSTGDAQNESSVDGYVHASVGYFCNEHRNEEVG